MPTIDVTTTTRHYPIHIERNACRHLSALCANRKVFVICDQNTQMFLPADLRAYPLRVLPDGETAKSFTELEKTLDWLLTHGVDRHAVLIAFGGGVVGDHAGFAASIMLRGIDFIQIPTTLLAQVDSSVGGKTGINTAHGKNLVGAFHQPLAVLIDPDSLASLPPRQYAAGMAEVIKYGLLGDMAFFDELAFATLPVEKIIETACHIKAHIVGKDEREESGQRALLNLGHTFGHALEWACGFDTRLLHGEAVAIGMCMATRLSIAAGLCPEPALDRLRAVLQRCALPTRLSDIKGWPAEMTPETLLRKMYGDKKAKNGFIRFVLIRNIGDAILHDSPIADEMTLRVLYESY